MPNQCSPRTQRVSENHGLCKPERATSTCIGGNVTLRMTPFLHLIWFDDSRSEFWFPNHSDPRCPRARNPGPDSPYCIQQCVCVCACMHACMCVWICIYVNIYTNTHTHTYTYIHTHMCVCVCVRVSFICVFLFHSRDRLHPSLAASSRASQQRSRSRGTSLHSLFQVESPSARVIYRFKD